MRSKDRQARPRGSAVRARKRAARNLLEHWNEVEAKIRNAQKVALFLDFDGTLAPIVAKPEDARIPEEAKLELRRVLGNSRYHVTMISGRRRGDLMERAGLDGPTYLGLYGWERETEQRAGQYAVKVIRRAHELLEPALRGIPGVWIEDKALSLAVHFLDAGTAEKRRAQARVLRTLKRFLARDLRIERNLRDWEILPRSCGDKGIGVRTELSRNGTRDALPVYIGDDVSDEAAFRALKHGITVRVGARGRTGAAYFVPAPADVALVLQRMAAVTR